MYSEDFLDDNDKNEIQCIKPRAAKTDLLLRKMIRSNKKAIFVSFLTYLGEREVLQGHITERLTSSHNKLPGIFL